MLRVEHAQIYSPEPHVGFEYRPYKNVPTSKRTSSRRWSPVVKLGRKVEEPSRVANLQAAMAWLRQIDLAQVEEIPEQDSGGCESIEYLEARELKRQRNQSGGAELCEDVRPDRGDLPSSVPIERIDVRVGGACRVQDAANEEEGSGKRLCCKDIPLQSPRMVLEAGPSPQPKPGEKVKRRAGRPSAKNQSHRESIQMEVNYPRFQPPGTDLSTKASFKEHKMKVVIQLTRGEIEADWIAITGETRKGRRSAATKRVRGGRWWRKVGQCVRVYNSKPSTTIP